MRFQIRMGIPDMAEVWEDLVRRNNIGGLGEAEKRFFKKLVKALRYLAENPRHNSLASHEIADLTKKHGFKIFQSHLENDTPAAGRIFWSYGPDSQEITILAVEPHPEDQKRGAYQRIRLSKLPASKGKPKPSG
jgi:hypothetical protein